MPWRSDHHPTYRLHRVSGQGIVTLDGRDHYLGPYGTEQSRREYDRLIGEWLLQGRQSPDDRRVAVSVTELIAAFWTHAKTYYRRPDGTPTTELKNFKDALKPLRRTYGHTTAAEFGPLALKAVREEMIRMKWARTNINKQVGRVKRVFKWAVENELVPPDVFHGLQAVASLKAGRSEARETEPVKPVPKEQVDAVLPYLSRQVAAMVQLQLLTGMRPGEVIAMRPLDLDMAEEVWLYRPATHKTLHHGHRRVIHLGPRAQEILRPFLTDRALHLPLFAPAEAIAELRAKRHADRRTPSSCGNNIGTNRVVRPRRKAGERYTVPSYGRAIKYACAKAGIAGWHPHQLRHSYATNVRRAHGLEAAQVLLGHHTLSATQVYAERDEASAKAIASKVG